MKVFLAARHDKDGEIARSFLRARGVEFEEATPGFLSQFPGIKQPAVIMPGGCRTFEGIGGIHAVAQELLFKRCW